MKEDERVVKDVPERVRARNVERVCVMKDRLVCAVRFFQPPIVRDGVGAVIVVQGRQLCWSNPNLGLVVGPTFINYWRSKKKCFKVKTPYKHLFTP